MNQRIIKRMAYHTKIVRAATRGSGQTRHGLRHKQKSKGDSRTFRKTMVNESRHKSKCVFWLERPQGNWLCKISDLIRLE